MCALQAERDQHILSDKHITSAHSKILSSSQHSSTN